MNDAAWAVYTYGTLRRQAERYQKELASYAATIAAGSADIAGEQPLPPRPSVPKWPTPPSATILCNFEQRRVEWVQEVKDAGNYTEEIGQTLGIAPMTRFNSWAFRAELLGLVCTGPKTVAGKFRKAHGNIEGIVLRGRRSGTASWTELGRFKATPFSASVPIAGGEPQEEWEFQARGLKRDLEVGVASEIIGTMIEA
jgi:hypothetical protein